MEIIADEFPWLHFNNSFMTALCVLSLASPQHPRLAWLSFSSVSCCSSHWTNCLYYKAKYQTVTDIFATHLPTWLTLSTLWLNAPLPEDCHGHKSMMLFHVSLWKAICIFFTHYNLWYTVSLCAGVSMVVECSLEGYTQHIWLMARLSVHAHANHFCDWLCCS